MFISTCLASFFTLIIMIFIIIFWLIIGSIIYINNNICNGLVSDVYDTRFISLNDFISLLKPIK